ncbi:MAG: DUF2460 domain-containing protein [Rhodobacteraceae bacterium]|nr:DUF2460 domain-containing protein [Paracoccaceae bacterium]
MNFHEERFPASLSFGAVGGPERRTEIVTLNSGHEERNTPWEHSRRRYDAGLAMRSLDDLGQVIAFFEARRGPLFGFRWKDWSDFKSCLPSIDPGFGDQEVGVGDGTNLVFQLRKTYQSGAESYERQISKPVSSSLRVGVDGSEVSEGLDFGCDYNTGAVTFVVAPAAGELVTAGFAFDVPVRFDSDRLEMSVASFAAGDIPSVPVVEVRV